MIGKAGSGASVGGLVHYILHGSAVTHEKTPAWVDVRNLAGENPDRLHVEMEATASQSPRTQKPIYHLVLSPAPEDQLDRKD